MMPVARHSLFFCCALLLSVCVAVPASAQFRDQIRITGSSSVFPFATSVAEEFGRTSNFKAPIVEGIGTGGGMKLFCQGIGPSTPDIVNASRRIKASEMMLCDKNGVHDIIEVRFGLDGIILANTKVSPHFTLSLRHIYLALAAKVPAPGTTGGEANLIDNPYKRWNEIDPTLPNQPISVLGPPPTSGTRDAFVETALDVGCASYSGNAAVYGENQKRFRLICRTIREDGHYIESGENDNLIVQKLQANPTAIGIFAWSFLDQNSDVLQASDIIDLSGSPVTPTYDSISEMHYPIFRSLYFYIKKAHIGSVPGIHEYARAFTSEDSWGEYGYLTDRGLIPLSEEDRRFVRSHIETLQPMEQITSDARLQ